MLSGGSLAPVRSGALVPPAEDAVDPGLAVPATKPADVLTVADAFVAQMTRYTDASGNIANVKDATFKYGPYIKGTSLPLNPFNNLNTVLIDTATDNITTRAADGSTGWKFYAKTGVLIANDGAHTSE